MRRHGRTWLAVLALMVVIPLAVILTAVAVRGTARGLARALVVDEPLQRADTIFVLASQRMSRTIEAGALFREGWAPQIILSPNDSADWSRVMEAAGIRIPGFSDLQISALVQMGVPRESIHELGAEPASTFDEARQISELARTRGWSRIIVVTSSYHTRRASLYLRRQEHAGLEFVVRRTRFEKIHTDRWWRMPGERIDVALEYLKLPKLLVTRLAPATASPLRLSPEGSREP